MLHQTARMRLPEQAALEAVTATHQLNAAIDALAKCTRPMLLARTFTPRCSMNNDDVAEEVRRFCAHSP